MQLWHTGALTPIVDTKLDKPYNVNLAALIKIVKGEIKPPVNFYDPCQRYAEFIANHEPVAEPSNTERCELCLCRYDHSVDLTLGEYSALKGRLSRDIPAVVPSIITPHAKFEEGYEGKGWRAEEHAEQWQFTDIYHIDIDCKHNPDIDFDLLYAELQKQPEAAAGYRSKSGGIKLFGIGRPGSSTRQNFTEYANALAAVVREANAEVKVDAAVYSPNELCFLAVDASAFYNAEAYWLEPVDEAPANFTAQPKRRKSGGAGRGLAASDFDKLLTGLDNNEVPYIMDGTILKMACPVHYYEGSSPDSVHIYEAGGTLVIKDHGSGDCDYWEIAQAVYDMAGVAMPARTAEPVDLSEKFPNARHIERRAVTCTGDFDMQCTVLQDTVRLLEYGQDMLLAAKQDGGVYELLIVNDCGIWLADEGRIAQLMAEANAEWRNEAQRQAANSQRKESGRMIAEIGEWSVEVHKPGHRQNVLKNIGMAIEHCRAEGIDLAGLTICPAEDLNANKRYIGAQNGVIDLHTGKLLDAAAGRLCLVTRQTPTAYMPDATHPIADGLTAHLNDILADYVWRGAGYAMHGEPDREYFQLLGEKGGAKSTLINAFYSALGDHRLNGYGIVIESNALADTGRKDDSSHSAMLIGIDVARIGIISELPEKLSGVRLKRLTGGDMLVLREIHKKTTPAGAASATIFVACNPPDKDKIDITDDALAERARVLPYPALPKSQQKTSVLKAVKNDPAVKAAVLAKLVHYAGKAVGLEQAPEPPPEVIAETIKLRHEQLGPAGCWAAEYLAWDRSGVKYGLKAIEILEYFEATAEDLVTEAKDDDGDVKRANIGGVYAEVKLYAGFEPKDFIAELKRLKLIPQRLELVRDIGKVYKGLSKVVNVEDGKNDEPLPADWQQSV